MAKQASPSSTVGSYFASANSLPLAALAMNPASRWKGLYKRWEPAAINGVQVNVQAPWRSGREPVNRSFTACYDETTQLRGPGFAPPGVHLFFAFCLLVIRSDYRVLPLPLDPQGLSLFPPFWRLSIDGRCIKRTLVILAHLAVTVQLQGWTFNLGRLCRTSSRAFCTEGTVQAEQCRMRVSRGGFWKCQLENTPRLLLKISMLQPWDSKDKPGNQVGSVKCMEGVAEAGHNWEPRI